MELPLEEIGADLHLLRSFLAMTNLEHSQHLDLLLYLRLIPRLH
jgi:hypothetical protein